MHFDVEALCLGAKRGKYLERSSPAVAAIWHTTGSGPLRRATEKRFARWRNRWGVDYGDAFMAAVVLYTRIMTASPHVVLCAETGRTALVCPPNLCAWHVGGSRSRAYHRGRWASRAPQRYAWWRERWPGLESPRELAGGKLWAPYVAPEGWTPGRAHARMVASYQRGSANANSLGCDIVPRAGGGMSDAALAAAVDLAEWFEDHGEIPRTRDSHITHSDAHPLSRTTPSGIPWDPRDDMREPLMAALRVA